MPPVLDNALVAGDYWQSEPSCPARERMVALDLPGVSLELATASGVFGAQRIDHGTMVLLRRAPIPSACSGVVDLGTGYGPIAVALGLRQPSSGVWAVDVNQRALELARRNAEELKKDLAAAKRYRDMK